MIRKLLSLTAVRMAVVGVLVSGNSGMVLCIGNDGHIAVEPVQHGHCGHAHAEDDHGHEETSAGDTCAAACETDGCVDVPLGGVTLSPAPKPLTQDHLEKGAAEASIFFGYDPFARTAVHECRRPAYGATHILAQSLREKRTIVLLV